MKLRFVMILLLLPLVVAETTIAIDINFATDHSSYRCRGGIVALGDLDRTVDDKCGDPLTVIRRPSDSYDYWVYTNGASKFMYYLGFLHGKLQRIISLPCSNNNAECFDAR